MRIKTQAPVDTDAMAAGQRRLNAAKQASFEAMKDLRERRRALGANKRQGRVGGVHQDAMFHAIEERGKTVLNDDDYWRFEQTKNPWMTLDGHAPNTDSINGHKTRQGKVSTKIIFRNGYAITLAWNKKKHDWNVVKREKIG